MANAADRRHRRQPPPGAEGPAGATANAVCSLSIEPMLMLACLDRGSRTLLAVQAANRFGISVLHAGQEEIARAFATKAPVAEKWDGRRVERARRACRRSTTPSSASPATCAT